MAPSQNQPDEHGKPAVTIYVNTHEIEWAKKEISYEEVYDIAYPNDPLNDGDIARVEYSRGANSGGSGSLSRGQSVNVKKGMIFDVYVTVRS
jgi:hypothetical protein